MVNAFKAFQCYIALKNHFTSSYDFFRYNGKTNAKYTTFEKRRDVAQFKRLAEREDYADFLLANMIVNPNQWVGDLFTEKAERIYSDWKRRKQSLSYIIEQDLQNLHPDFNLNFVVVENSTELLEQYKIGNIHLETMVVLDVLLNYRERWDREIQEHYVWPEISNLIKNYTPFLKFDKQKIRKKTLDLFTKI